MIKIIEDIDILEEIRERLRNEGKYSYVAPPSKYGTLLVKENDEWFHIYINKNKKPVRLYEKIYNYEDAVSFSEGLAWVRKNGKEFHITPDGKPAYEERYDWVGSFSNGVTRVRKDKKEFHITPDGKPLYEERFDYVTMFSDKGYSLVIKNRKKERIERGKERFYINRNGKRIDQSY